MPDKAKVRFAPSPTGYLHMGGLRTALFNYLFARHNHGRFILRIEDTDRERLVPGAEEDIEQTLKNFDLTWDEKYKQTDRLDVYKKYADQLLAEDKAYEETGERGRAIRFRMPKTGVSEFADTVYGKLAFKNELIKDPIILKSDGYPVYNLANVIDDHEMGITHVIRGEEFLSSTPIHVQLYQALGWQVPKFVHLPLILDRERKKLSKRTGDVAVKEYIDKGYLKEALANFIVLLGWNPKTTDEIFSLDELIEKFDIRKINKAGAIFDVEKLDFINRQWQKKLDLGPNDPLYKKAFASLSSTFSNFDRDLFASVWPLILERIKGPSQLHDALPEFHFFFTEPQYDPELLIWKDTSKDSIKNNLQILSDFVNKQSSWQNLEAGTLRMLEERGIGKGEALWPLRVALAGRKNSPGPFEILAVFDQIPKGREIVQGRIERAIEKL